MSNRNLEQAMATATEHLKESFANSGVIHPNFSPEKIEHIKKMLADFSNIVAPVGRLIEKQNLVAGISLPPGLLSLKTPNSNAGTISTMTGAATKTYSSNYTASLPDFPPKYKLKNLEADGDGFIITLTPDE